MFFFFRNVQYISSIYAFSTKRVIFYSVHLLKNKSDKPNNSEWCAHISSIDRKPQTLKSYLNVKLYLLWVL